MTYHFFKHYESIVIEVDKTLFNTNRNTIIGEIYISPSSNLKTFNIELEKLLIKIKKENKYNNLIIIVWCVVAFIMGDFNVNSILETKITQNRFTIYFLDSSPQLCRVCLMIQRLHKLSPLLSFMFVRYSGDLIVHLWQDGRGRVSGSEVISCSHLFQ